MKRIVDGVTYNTDTSTKLGSSEYEVEYNHDNRPCVGVLYQTRGGAYFVHQEITVRVVEYEGDELVDTRDRFEPLSEAQARAWIMTGDVEIFHNPFGEVPEAAVEAEPGATLYVRVPASLKKRVDEIAQQSNLSTNAWAIRCMERCLTRHFI